VVPDSYDATPLFLQIDTFYLRNEKIRLNYSTFFRVVKDAVEIASENELVSPHWFRHTYATMILEKGVELSKAQQLLGHANIATTNLYLEKLSDDKIADVADIIDF